MKKRDCKIEIEKIKWIAKVLLNHQLILFGYIVQLFNVVIQMSTFFIKLGYTLIVNFEIIPSVYILFIIFYFSKHNFLMVSASFARVNNCYLLAIA